MSLSLKESLQKLFGGSKQPKLEDGFVVEGPGKKEIGFFDLRDAEAAKEKGVEPGIYLSAFPITKEELKDEFLLHKLTFSFFEKMAEVGLMKSSNTRISVDTQMTGFVDPEQMWAFQPVVYIQGQQLLIVETQQQDRDASQALLVKVLSNKR